MPRKLIVGDFVQMPPGEYEAIFFGFETRLLFGRQPKLYLWFTITTPGYIGIKLPIYFNVLSLSGRPRRSGRFKAGLRGDFVREYGRLFGELPDTESDWDESFKNVVCTVRVRTCSRSFKQQDIAECAQYSHIAEILEVHTSKQSPDDVAPMPNPSPEPTPAPI